MTGKHCSSALCVPPPSGEGCPQRDERTRLAFDTAGPRPARAVNGAKTIMLLRYIRLPRFTFLARRAAFSSGGGPIAAGQIDICLRGPSLGVVGFLRRLARVCRRRFVEVMNAATAAGP